MQELFSIQLQTGGGSRVAPEVRNLPADAGDARDVDLVPGQEDLLE